ncbi:MAG: hypothetical protein C0519_01330 [Hyphomicrobium sp.]|nr:hypothetical protein [Hyphomicrobium sp.]
MEWLAALRTLIPLFVVIVGLFVAALLVEKTIAATLERRGWNTAWIVIPAGFALLCFVLIGPQYAARHLLFNEHERYDLFDQWVLGNETLLRPIDKLVTRVDEAAVKTSTKRLEALSKICSGQSVDTQDLNLGIPLPSSSMAGLIKDSGACNRLADHKKYHERVSDGWLSSKALANVPYQTLFSNFNPLPGPILTAVSVSELNTNDRRVFWILAGWNLIVITFVILFAQLWADHIYKSLKSATARLDENP